MFRAPPLPRTLEAALRDVTADKPAVRAAAARDLAAHAEVARDRVVHGLERALRDEDSSVRAAAAVALADIEGHEALPALLMAVEDEDAFVRQMAITALGEIGDPRATERLRRALNDERAEVRFQAAMAFPRVTASRDDAITALVMASNDDDAIVCHAALRMAEELSEPPHELDPRLITRAKVLVDHAAPEVRVVAAIVLARAGERRGESVLAQVARGEIKTREQEDEATAIELAGELGIEDALPGLERRAFGNILGFRRDRFAWHARVALARMGHERACREIMGELVSSDRDKRTLAVAAAGRAHLAEAHDRIAAMRGDEQRADPHAVDEALAALAPKAPEADEERMTESRFTEDDLAPREEDKRAATRATVDRIAATTAVLAAGLWVGGMLALGACAAPFVFRLTPAPYSGDAMGAAFARFDQFAIGAGVVLLGAEVVRTWAAGAREARSRAARFRRAIAVLMACGAAYGGLSLTPHIQALHRAGAQRNVGPDGDELERTHKRAEAIGKAQTFFGVVVVALHIFTLGSRRPDEDDDFQAPAAPGPGRG